MDTSEIDETTSSSDQSGAQLRTQPGPRPATPGPGPRRLTLLDLPYELRLDIYELLLLAPEPIIVSSRRRQLRVRIEPPEHRNTYLRAPRPTPRAVTLAHRKPHAEILRTCKLVNREGTPVLYRKNDFIVGLKLCARGEVRVEPADAAGFFASSLRQSTLCQLSSITFRGACLCDHWLTLAAPAGRCVAGTQLSRMCVDDRPSAGSLVPDAERAQAAYLLLCNSLLDLEKDFGRFKVCAFCNASYGQHCFI